MTGSGPPGGAPGHDAPLVRNLVSLVGAGVTTVSAVAFIVYVALEAFGLMPGPYAGLIGYVLIPAVLGAGLLLIPAGIWREARRRRAGASAWHWPQVDLGLTRTRQVVLALFVLTLVNLGLVTVAGVGVVQYTESDRFCGQVCHTPMTPEFVAHRVSPHAEVACVSCHVGPGASGAVTAKLNGTRQLFLLATNRFARPIPEPIGRIPGAAGTCAHCHTPGRPAVELARTLTTYADDAASTETTTTLTMHMSANHWHARSDVVVEYASTDPAALTIPYVRVTDGQGHVTEYLADGVTAPPSGPLHRMDCLDCHNRPAHTFAATPDRAVDALMATGAVNRDLPFLHREMVAVLKGDYASPEAASLAMGDHLRTTYRTADARLGPDLDRAIAATAALYRQNVFPAMHVGWGTYLSQNGHVDQPGCFRCHDESHKTRDGRAIRQDCELCHHTQ